MTIYRVLLQSLRRSSLHTTTTSLTATTFIRTAFTTAEEAAAERRRRKRRLRIEPPLHALTRDPRSRPRPDPNAPRLPDSTSSLVGPRLNLHNRVQSLIRGGDLEQASAIARHSVFSNTRPTVFTCNAIIASMYRAKRYEDAIALFQYFFNQSNIVPNIVSYNNLINTYCDTGKVDIGLEVYRHIIAHAPFGPSPVTYRHLTKGLVEADRIEDAIDLLREMLNKGHGADSHVYNNIISGYLKLGNLARANEFFDELNERCLVYDGIVNATFMEWYFEKGMDNEAMQNYQAYLDRNFRMTPATGNVLLETLIKHGKSEEANALFESMLSNHKTPNVHAVNSDTYNLMVNECFRLGNISEAKAVFKQVGKAAGSKPFQMDNVGYNNMIDKLCQNGLVEDAEMLFQEMVSKHVLLDYNSFRFLIEAYFKEGKTDAVLEKINGFLNTNLKSNPRFYNMVFGGLIDDGRVDDASNCIEKLGEKEVKPDPTSYELVILALLKESKLDRTRDLLSQMVTYNVGLTTALKSAVDEAFANEGRSDELALLLGRQNQAREGVAARGQYQGREGGFSRGPYQSREGPFARPPSPAVNQAPPSGTGQATPSMQQAPEAVTHQAPPYTMNQPPPPSGMSQAPPYSMHQPPTSSMHQPPPYTMHQPPPSHRGQAPPSSMHQAPSYATNQPLPSSMHQALPYATNQPPPSTTHQAPPSHQPPYAMHQAPPLDTNHDPQQVASSW
ncbi:hypothetical protein ACHQM5_018572 [Ranunculus cassubicifolius]